MNEMPSVVTERVDDIPSGQRGSRSGHPPEGHIKMLRPAGQRRTTTVGMAPERLVPRGSSALESDGPLYVTLE